MKKILLIFFSLFLLNSERIFSQFSENITNSQFNSFLTFFKGRRSDFGTYNFSNFPCATCSGGYFYIKDDNSLIASYSYSGVLFNGVLKNPKLNFDQKGNTLYLTSDWLNTSNNGGQKFAKISFEYSFGSEYYSWNTLLRYQSGNTEMVAYYKLSRKQLDEVYTFLVKNTKYSDIIIEEKRKNNLANQERLLSDSLKNDKKSKEKSENDRLKRLQDSIILVKDDSLRRTLIIGSTYKDGIVFQIDSNFHGKLIKKRISEDLHFIANETEIARVESKFDSEDQQPFKSNYNKRFDYFKLNTSIESVNIKINKLAPDWRMMKYEEARSLLDILQSDKIFYKRLEDLYPPSSGWLNPKKYEFGLKNKWIYSYNDNNDPLLINFDDKEFNVNDENTVNSYKGFFKIIKLMYIISDIRIIPVKEF
jgi:hypothetical protein